MVCGWTVPKVFEGPLEVLKNYSKLCFLQVGENEPFVSELLTLPTTIADLEPHQIHSFYESVGNMIQAEPDPHKRDEYLQSLMELPNQSERLPRLFGFLSLFISSSRNAHHRYSHSSRQYSSLQLQALPPILYRNPSRTSFCC